MKFLVFILLVSQGLACKSGEFQATKRTEFRGNPEEICTDILPKNAEDAVKISVRNQKLELKSNPVVNSKLEIIEMEYNKLSLQPGCFANYPKLWILSLVDNGLKSISKGVFNHLAVRKLNLSGNAIEGVEVGALDDMPNLEVLDLSNNKLKKVDSTWFKGSPKLDWLNFDYNQIGELQEGAFGNLIDGRRKSKKLSIWLSYNNIERIHPQAFKGFGVLGSLWLSHNKVNTLAGGPLRNLKMESLFLDHNQIVCLGEEDLVGLRGIGEIFLQGNPLNCDCLKGVKSWAKRENVQVNVLGRSVECLQAKLQGLKKEILS